MIENKTTRVELITSIVTTTVVEKGAIIATMIATEVEIATGTTTTTALQFRLNH